MSAEVRRAAEILRAGGLVAFPTETVYGLGADAASARAVARLYAVKRRPVIHPVIVHFADAATAFEWASEVPAAARSLAAKFWPGPLTMILKRSDKAKDFVTGGQDTVGLRVPAHPIAHEMLVAFGGGVAAPSANRFGRVSPTSAAHVRADLGADVELVLEGGDAQYGIESTIVDVSRGAPVLLRPGHVTLAELEQALGQPVAAKDADAPAHSGGLERHYAPATPARLVATPALGTEIARHGARCAVLAFGAPHDAVDFWLRMPDDPEAYARRLYAALRELDESGCDAILIEAPPSTPAWAAVHDRLMRAASPEPT